MFQAMHLYPVVWVLGDGLPVAGHRLLDEAENFHVAVPARHDHPGPSEAHGHFHAAAAGGRARAPRRAQPEQPGPGPGPGPGTLGAEEPRGTRTRGRLGARAGGGDAGGPLSSHARSGPATLASPGARLASPRRGARSLRPPVRRLGALAGCGPGLCGAEIGRAHV